MEDGHFDVVIFGTGLTESITAAALSKAGVKVAQIDANNYYGGNEASLSLDELLNWLQGHSTGLSSKYTSVSWSGGTLKQSRQYAICLRPSIIPSIGPIISSLISSGVSKYGGFRLLEHVGIYHKSQVVKSVPGTKEDVFKTKEISLIDKRRLMRFLMFAVSDFDDDPNYLRAGDTPFAEYLKTQYSLSDDITAAIVFALAFCQTDKDLTKDALPRMRKYLRSAGRYGASPYLVGHYGGTGEIAQGFCRAAAVSGATYILGRQLRSVTQEEVPTEGDGPQARPRYQFTLDDFPEPLAADVVVAPSSQDVWNYIPSRIPPSSQSTTEDDRAHVARCIAIVDTPIRIPDSSSADSSDSTEEADTPEEEPTTQEKALDAGVIVFPPSTVSGGSTSTTATLLVTGEGSLSTPAGKCMFLTTVSSPLLTLVSPGILYITIPVNEETTKSSTAEQVIKPYLDATMALTRPLASTSNPLPEDSQGSDQPQQPLFSACYFEHPEPAIGPGESSENDTDPSPASPKTAIAVPALSPSLQISEAPDVAAVNAEKVFWEVINSLKAVKPGDRDDGSSVDFSVESFWPPVDPGNESDGEDGW